MEVIKCFVGKIRWRETRGKSAALTPLCEDKFCMYSSRTPFRTVFLNHGYFKIYGVQLPEFPSWHAEEVHLS